jgi:hypothetical protein
MDQNGLFFGGTVISHQDFIEPELLESSPGLHEVIIGAVDQGGSENSGIREDIQNLLLPYIFGGVIQRNGIGLGSGTGKMD